MYLYDEYVMHFQSDRASHRVLTDHAVIKQSRSEALQPNEG